MPPSIKILSKRRGCLGTFNELSELKAIPFVSSLKLKKVGGVMESWSAQKLGSHEFHGSSHVAHHVMANSIFCNFVVSGGCFFTFM